MEESTMEMTLKKIMKKGEKKNENWKELTLDRKYHEDPCNNPAASLERSQKFCFGLFQQKHGAQDVANVFSGNLLEYHYFMEIFRKVVEKRIVDHRRRLKKLILCTRGETRFD